MLPRAIRATCLLTRIKSPAASISLAQHSTQSTSSMPRWLEELLRDKKIYFNSVDEIEQSFMTGIKVGQGKFTFNFDKSLNEKFREIHVSFDALRETCRCPECFAPSSQQRLNSLYFNPHGQKPETYHFDQENQLLKIKWAGSGHESVYSGPCVYANFSPHPLFEYQPKRLWNSKQYMEEFQVFDFEQVYSSDSKMIEFLDNLDKYGLVVIKNAPKKTGIQRQLSKKLSYLRKTHFGETFKVANKPTVSDLAYSTRTLLQHMDLGYFNYIPGIQLLHCIRNSGKGGENTFSDGFAVAEWLRTNKTDVFNILTENCLWFMNRTFDVGEAFLIQKRPLIGLKRDGSIEYVTISNSSTDALREIPPDEQIKLLKAVKTFISLNHSPEFKIQFKLQEGDIAVFDNCRVTHGRQAFESSEERLLEGCYYNWDEIYSRIRVLKANQFRKKLAEYYSNSFKLD